MHAFLNRGVLVAAAIYLAFLPTSGLTAGRSIAFGAGVVFSLAIVLMSWTGRAEGIPSPGNLLVAALLAWSACALASQAWSIRPEYTFAELRHELFPSLLTMAIFYLAARDRAGARVLVVAGLASFALLGGLVCVMALWGAGWDPVRWHGGVGAYSTYLVLVAAVLLTLLVPASAQRSGKALLVPSLALLALLLVTARMSDNRMVWIALTAVFATAFVLGALRWRSTVVQAPLRWLVPLLALFLVLGLLFTDVVRHRAKEDFPPNTSVVQTFRGDPRIALWELTLERIRARPWTGYGFGKSILDEELRTALRDRMLSHAHNIFVSQWLQIGGFGLAAFVALMAALGWRFAEFLRSTDDRLALVGLIGLSMLSGFMVKNLTDDFLFRSNAKEFWAFCGALLGHGVRLGQSCLRPARGHGTRHPSAGAAA